MIVGGKEYTVGADPEIFIGQNGKFVSAHGKIPGNKQQPYLVEKGAVQIDGMALEFNIDPAHNLEEFKGNLRHVESILAEMVGPDYDFLTQTSVHFDKEFLKSIPRENAMLGCSADYNGWTLDENPSPKSKQFMRTVGGHIHIGGFGQDDYYEWDYFKLCARIARALDETIGVYSLFWDKDDSRRDMYGKAGSFRPKPYGMEYRTLSNAWIFKDKLVDFVYEGVEKALDKVFVKNEDTSSIVQEIIDNSDRSNNYFKNDMSKGVIALVA